MRAARPAHFDDGGADSGAHVSHSFATPGTHTATVTVTDLEGLTASANVNVTVLPPPSALGRPVITKLAIRPRGLLAARSGPAAVPAAGAARTAGATVSYLDSQKATTTFAVGRLIRGVRVGRRCAAPKRTPGHHPRCTLLVGFGSFAHADVVGANRFRFTGRISGHRLPAGSYRLTAVARNSAGKSRPVFATFTVHH